MASREQAPNDNVPRARTRKQTSEGRHVPSIIEVGKTINNRYYLTRLIGEGGMGIVYEAHDTQVDRNVAIKLVRDECRSDSKFMSRFRRELEVTAQLRHPSTIRVFEHGQDQNGRPYMVMELLTGRSLASRLDDGVIPETLALEYALQIAESLSEAHANGIFHRDLKPDNIFIETVGVSTVVKVLDFGIAGGLDASRLTRAGEVFGTPQYMSPEQCNGHPLDHRTDIYSLGCMLFEMIEGAPPFSAESPMATMLKHVRARVPPLRNASRGTAKIINHALRKDRNKRIQDCGQFASALRETLNEIRSGNRSEIGMFDRWSEVPARIVASTRIASDLAVAGLETSTPLFGPSRKMLDRHRVVLPALAAAFALVVVTLFLSSGKSVDSSATSAASQKANRASSATVTTSEAVENHTNAAVDAGGIPRNHALIRTQPEAATVYLDGEPKCSTPCRIEVPVGDNTSHEIKVSLDGFVPQVLSWKPSTVSEEPPAFQPFRALGDH
jgi:serine/threonine-protein kinase